MSSWKGEDDELPEFGNRARKWFRLVVRQALETMLAREERQGKNPLPRETVALIIQRACEQPYRCVYCVPKDEYAGRGYSYYGWAVYERELSFVLQDLIENAREQLRESEFSEAFPSIDDWLRADIAGELPRWTKYQAQGSDNLTARMRGQLSAAARERRRRWPLVCKACGDSFLRRPGQRGRPLYCPACNEARAGTSEAPDRRC
jgi:hypothetical protein